MTTTLPPGTLIDGRYEVESLIGEGGIGEVYRARKRSTGTPFALKVMRTELGFSELVLKAFLDEARTAARVESEHVVRCDDCGVDPSLGLPWLTVELLHGNTLKDELSRRGALPRDEALGWLREAASGVAAAHRAKVVHCDLKPDNLFVCDAAGSAPRRLKVLDFGISRVVADTRTHTDNKLPGGTVLYMAPEQAAAFAPIRPSTDVWALGLIAFELLTGKSYWLAAQRPGLNLREMLVALRDDPLAPASQRAREIGATATLPPGFDAVFARCVVRDASRRFVDARALLDALVSLGGGPARASSIPETEALSEPLARLRALTVGLNDAEAKGDHEAAVDYAERLVALDPHTPGYAQRAAAARVAHGWGRLHAGAVDDALADARRAVELDPSLKGAHALSAQCLLRRGDAAGALAALDRAMRDGHPPTAWRRDRARLLHALGRFTEAASAWGDVVALEPAHWFHRAARAESLAAAGDHRGAVAELDVALTAAPDDVGLRLARARSAVALAQWSVAERDLTAALRAKPDSVVGWYERAVARRMLGDVSGARSDLEAAASRGDPRARHELTVMG